MAELERGLAALSVPLDRGTVEMVVARHDDGSHETPARVKMIPGQGVPGDRWSRRHPLRIEAEITLMRADIARLVGNGQPLSAAGDNLLVDLDLSLANLPAGTVLRAGTTLLEVTPLPHDGCVKFERKFGRDAVRLTADPRFRHLRLRGIHAKIVEAGEIAPGDLIEVIKRPGSVGQRAASWVPRTAIEWRCPALANANPLHTGLWHASSTATMIPDDSDDRPFFSLGFRFGGLVDVIAMLALASTWIGFLGGLLWFFDLFDHFRLQYLGVCLVAIVWFAWQRRWWVLAVALVSLGANAWPVARTTWVAAPDQPLSRWALKVVCFNVLTSNERKDEVVEFFRKSDADVIIALEVNTAWARALKKLEPGYPHLLVNTREDNFGIAVFSRVAWREARFRTFAQEEVLSFTATLRPRWPRGAPRGDASGPADEPRPQPQRHRPTRGHRQVRRRPAHAGSGCRRSQCRTVVACDQGVETRSRPRFPHARASLETDLDGDHTAHAAA